MHAWEGVSTALVRWHVSTLSKVTSQMVKSI
jgi:hypothetical protein